MKKLFASALLCCSLSAQAESGLDFVLSAGLTYGGDTLAETTVGTELKSGGLLYGAIGGVYHINEQFDLQATFGYHFDTLQASDGTADFDRFFIEILPFYIIDGNKRLGVGITNIMSAEYSDPYDTVGFEDSTGLIFELNWRAGSRAWWGIRYVNLDLVANELNGFTVPSVTIDGSYIGLMVHLNM